MSHPATVLASAAMILGPVAMAGLVTWLCEIRRARRRVARHPIGPLGRPIRDQRL
jgi:hypothetical protein